MTALTLAEVREMIATGEFTSEDIKRFNDLAKSNNIPATEDQIFTAMGMMSDDDDDEFVTYLKGLCSGNA